jgi:hypothetical protein
MAQLLPRLTRLADSEALGMGLTGAHRSFHSPQRLASERGALPQHPKPSREVVVAGREQRCEDRRAWQQERAEARRRHTAARKAAKREAARRG